MKDIDKLSAYYEDSDLFEIEMEDIGDDSCYVVLYGSGNYSIYSSDRIDTNSIFIALGILVGLMIILFIICLVLIKLKLTDGFERDFEIMKGMIQQKSIVQNNIDHYHNIFNKYKKLTTITVIIAPLAGLFFYLFFFVAIGIDYINLELIPINRDIRGFLMLLLFIFLCFIVIISYLLQERQKSWTKKLNKLMISSEITLKKEIVKPPIKKVLETTFPIGKNFHGFILLIFSGFWLYMLKNNLTSLNENISIICNIPILIIFIFILFVIFFIPEHMECKQGELNVYPGPKFLSKLMKNHKKFSSQKIKSIRPVPATLYYNHDYYLIWQRGRLRPVKTAVLITRKNGTVESIPTTKPQEIVALMTYGRIENEER